MLMIPAGTRNSTLSAKRFKLIYENKSKLAQISFSLTNVRTENLAKCSQLFLLSYPNPG